MRALRVFSALACALALAGCYVPPPLPPGKAAPPFRGKAQDGEHYSLLDLTRRGPVVVAFLSREGGTTREALDYLRLFAKAYGSKSSVVAVVDLTEEALRPWADERSPGLPVIPDVDGSIAAKYDVETAPTFVLVGRDSAKIGRWTGVSRSNLKELNRQLGAALETPPAAIALDNAPEQATKGDPVGHR